MINYDEIFYNTSLAVDIFNHTGPEPEGPFYKYSDFCRQFNYTNIDCEDEDSDTYDEEECLNIANGEIPWPGPKCFMTQKPLDFVYIKEDDAYRLDLYESDAHLLYKVRTGKGDPNIYTAFTSIFPNLFFAGTFPEDVETNFLTGENDVLTARAS